MILILILNIILNSIVCIMLFSLCSATINIALEKYKVIAISTLDGVIISTLNLITLPLLSGVMLYIVLFSSSCVVLFYPIKLQKVILLELVLLAYILLGWGLNYLLQSIFFNIFKITLKSFVVFGFMRGVTIVLLGLITYCFFRVCYKKKEIINFMYDVEVEMFGRRIKLKLFLDSGNGLYDDNLSGLPILVVSKEVVEQKLGGEFSVENLRRVGYSTINGKYAEMPVFEPENIFVFYDDCQNSVKALIGVVDIDFKSYDGLLHSAVM